MNLEEQLSKFVNANSNEIEMIWDKRLCPNFPFAPYTINFEHKKNIAHFLLLVSAIFEEKVTSNSENARNLLLFLHQKLGQDFSKISDQQFLQNNIEKWQYYSTLGELKSEIPKIISSVNKFVCEEAKGDLLTYSKGIDSARQFVKQLGMIERMGVVFEDKCWVFMRWMVRPYPDLHIFKFDKKKTTCTFNCKHNQSSNSCWLA